MTIACYDPQSEPRLPRDVVSFRCPPGRAMNIIDVHTHAFADGIAERAIEQLEAEVADKGIKSHLDGTIGALKGSMAQAGIALSVVQPVSTRASQVRPINDWAHEVSQDGILCFGTIFPGMEGSEQEVARLAELGIKGVKFHPDYQRFFPDDRWVYPIYEALSHYGLIVMFHAGKDIGLYPPVHATPGRIAQVLSDFPELTVVAAHLGSYEMWDEVEEVLVGKRIFFDTSYVFNHMDQGRALRIMEEHGFERILFGTDSPWERQDLEVQAFQRLPIPDDAKEAILSENAQQVLDIRGGKTK